MRRHFIAWLLLCLAVAVHVTDEALTGFLSVYNPSVLAIRRRLPFLPIPRFTFGVWLTLLILAIVSLLMLSRFVRQGRRWTVYASYVAAVLMILNGCGHLGGSIYEGRLMPGVYSSPFLIAASVYLLVCARRRQASADPSFPRR